MKLEILCRCSLFPSWSGQGLISTPVQPFFFARELPPRNPTQNAFHSNCFTIVISPHKFIVSDLAVLYSVREKNYKPCQLDTTLFLERHFTLIHFSIPKESLSSRISYKLFRRHHFLAVAYPGIFFGGGSTNSVEDRGQRALQSGDLEAAVIWYKKFQFIWKNVLNFWYFSLFMTTTNLFVIANVKQLRTVRQFQNFTAFLPNILGC